MIAGMSTETRPQERASTRRDVLPPLEHGDHLSPGEFERRLLLQPRASPATLVNGRVVLADGVRTLPGESPMLENGACMTREEFDTVTALHPEVKRAERIDGKVYLQMAVSQLHARAHALIIAWLSAYWARHADCEVLAEGTARLGADSDPQPDAMLRRTTLGSSGVEAGIAGMVVGPPELIVEVSASSASYDLFEKKALYLRNGVLEYVVWQLYEQRLDWFRLEGSEYVPQAPDESGVFESRVFPGLRLPIAALLAGDVAAVMSAVR